MAKKITKLTPEQEARIPEWVDKWVKIGLQTGKSDFKTFDKNIKLAYEKAKIAFPNKPIIRVQSPLVGAFASSIADKIINNGKGESFSAVDSAVGSAVSSAVDSAVRSAVRSAVSSAVGSAVDSAVGSAVSSAVDSAVGSAVSSAVDSAVRSAVSSAVGSAVDSAVGSAVSSAVSSAVDSAVRSAQLAWHWWFGGQFWVGGWYGSPSYVSFFTEVCGLEFDKDIQERAIIYDKLCRSVNYFWTNTNFVMVCERPIRIARNEEGQLHSDQVKAIEYPDGWGLYALDGVVLPEDLWNKIISQKMTFKEIMAIEISDQRTVALKYNPEAVIKENAVLIHKDDRNNELYLIEKQQLNKDLEFPKIWFLKMKCPTGRIFIEGVPPDEAEKNPNATDMQAILCGLTPSEYQSMVMES